MRRSGMSVGLVLLGALWALGAGVAVAQDKPGATPAQPPAAATPASPALSARELGIAEALLDYCSQKDPTGAVKVRERLKELTRGADKQALAAARKSPEYHSAHDSEANFISKVDSHNAHALCVGTHAR